VRRSARQEEEGQAHPGRGNLPHGTGPPAFSCGSNPLVGASSPGPQSNPTRQPTGPPEPLTGWGGVGAHSHSIPGPQLSFGENLERKSSDHADTSHHIRLHRMFSSSTEPKHWTLGVYSSPSFAFRFSADLLRLLLRTHKPNRSYTDPEPQTCLPCLETEKPDIDAQSFPHRHEHWNGRPLTTFQLSTLARIPGPPLHSPTACSR
jgi:hypothetical protein